MAALATDLLSQSNAPLPLAAPAGRRNAPQRRAETSGYLRLEVKGLVALFAFLHLPQGFSDNFTGTSVATTGGFLGHVAVEVLREADFHREEISVRGRKSQNEFSLEPEQIFDLRIVKAGLGD
jgi:hypothetical protein